VSQPSKRDDHLSYALAKRRSLTAVLSFDTAAAQGADSVLKESIHARGKEMRSTQKSDYCL